VIFKLRHIKYMEERLHRKLDVWKRSILLARKIHEISNKFPTKAHYNLSSQLMNSAISVPSNIAEGAARLGKQEKLHFFNIAQGSLSELDTQIEISHKFNYINKSIYNDLLEEVKIISRQLYGLSRKVKFSK